MDEQWILPGDRKEWIAAVRAWAKGITVQGPPPELSLFINCERFHCLPDSGGWYDQSPEVCFAFSLISSIISEEEEKKAKKNKSHRL